MFSQTVEYALRAMMHLASLDGTPETSERIAAETKVPPGYLCKVMRDLVRARLVESYRGRGGGFVLAARPADITILDVVGAVDPIRRIHKCPMDKPEHAKLCPLHQRLDEALASVESSFRKTTLAEVLAAGGMSEPEPRCGCSAPACERRKAS
jgi:Rrf2 family protein